MRILHVITSLATGGAEHLMVDLLPRLKDFGHEVELCVFYGAQTPFYEELTKKGIKIHNLSNRPDYYNPVHLLRLRKIIKRFDIVHTHNTAAQFFAAIVKPQSIKLFTTEHSTSTRRRNYRIFRPIDKLMYKRYDRIICISKIAEDSLVNYIGSNYPIQTIENGVDISKIISAQSIDLGLGNKITLTMVAGFRYEKDQPTLIKALLHLPEEYHVVLVGDGDKRGEIQSLISDLKLNDRVHMLGIRTDVASILKSSDIIVMSSHREGLSLSNIEGMASGKPFVASDVDGLREVTKGAGLLFPHADSEKLAQIVQELVQDEVYRQEVIDRCMARARMFDISSMAERYNQSYNID